MEIKVLIKLLEHGAHLALPSYATQGSAGVDLAAAIKEKIVLTPGEIVVVPTGIAVALPSGYELQIRPRSGLAIKHGVTVVNAPGTIDADYRGEIKVGLVHLGSRPYEIQPGARIAQMVLAAVSRISWQQTDELPPTQRGAGGFGHTGN